MAHFLSTRDPIVLDIIRALDLDPDNVRRVVIDFEVGKAAMVYVEQFMDSKALEVIKPTDIQKMQVKISSKEDSHYNSEYEPKDKFCRCGRPIIHDAFNNIYQCEFLPVED